MKRQPFTLALAVLVALHACNAEEPQPHPGFEDVLLQGDVTGDSLAAFVHATRMRAPVPQSPKLVIIWPANGEKIPKAQRDLLTFCWVISTSARAPGFAPPASAGVRWAGLLDAAPAVHAPAWLAPFAELLGPARAAHAEPTSYEGMVTYAVFSTADDPALIRVLTSELDYNPTVDVLEKMAAATQPITLRLTTAFVTPESDVADGPFLGPEMRFSLER